MGRNIQRLGDTLIKRMQTTASATDTVSTELGTINYNKSLSPDSLMGIAIPEEDYTIINRYNPKDGDRVLVAWCGEEPVVVGPAPKATLVVSSDGKGNVTIEIGD